MKPKVTIKDVAIGTAAIFCVIGIFMQFLILFDNTVEGSRARGSGIITILLESIIAIISFLGTLYYFYGDSKVIFNS